MITRIAQRLVLKEETVWARLWELRARRQGNDRKEAEPAERKAPAAPEERQLLEVLLADEALVPAAAAEVRPEEVRHPGLRRLLAGLYALHAEGQPPTLDLLRARLDGDPLLGHALAMQDVGRRHPDRAGWLRDLLARFRERRLKPVEQAIKNQLHAASDHQAALELLRQLQNRTVAGGGGPPPLSA